MITNKNENNVVSLIFTFYFTLCKRYFSKRTCIGFFFRFTCIEQSGWDVRKYS